MRGIEDISFRWWRKPGLAVLDTWQFKLVTSLASWIGSCMCYRLHHRSLVFWLDKMMIESCSRSNFWCCMRDKLLTAALNERVIQTNQVAPVLIQVAFEGVDWWCQPNWVREAVPPVYYPLCCCRASTGMVARLYSMIQQGSDEVLVQLDEGCLSQKIERSSYEAYHSSCSLWPKLGPCFPWSIHIACRLYEYSQVQ